MKNPFEFLKKKMPQTGGGTDDAITAEQYLQSAAGLSDEHKRAEALGEAKKETTTIEGGDIVEKLVSKDGLILEYINKTDLTKIEQQKIQENIKNRQEQMRRERLS